MVLVPLHMLVMQELVSAITRLIFQTTDQDFFTIDAGHVFFLDKANRSEDRRVNYLLRDQPRLQVVLM